LESLRDFQKSRESKLKNCLRRKQLMPSINWNLKHLKSGRLNKQQMQQRLRRTPKSQLRPRAKSSLLPRKERIQKNLILMCHNLRFQKFMNTNL
jgi:hypothetical protein